MRKLEKSQKRNSAGAKEFRRLHRHGQCRTHSRYAQRAPWKTEIAGHRGWIKGVHVRDTFVAIRSMLRKSTTK
jgi:hypothetical protein